MCFSAEASFIAATFLGAAGLYLGYQNWNKSTFWLAITPLFFALQQFSEGWLWLGLNQGTYPDFSSLFAQYVYLFFAYLFWPVWVPSVALTAEPVKKKATWLKAILLLGFVIFLFNGIDLIKSYPILAKVVGHSIRYGQVTYWMACIYAAVVIAPFFIISIPRMKWVGISDSLFLCPFHSRLQSRIHLHLVFFFSDSDAPFFVCLSKREQKTFALKARVISNSL